MNIEQFTKCASEYLDTDYIPSHIVKAAYSVYSDLPPNSAEWVLKAYDSTEDANAKLAFEIVGAAMVKQANPLALAGMALRGIGSTLMRGAGSVAKHVGMEAAMAAPVAMSKINQKSNSLQQGSQAISSVANGVMS